MDTTNLTSYKSLSCTKCGRMVNNVGDTAVKVTCSYCVLMSVGFPTESTVTTYKPTGRPPGWHFMVEFVDKDGNVFHKGKEQPKLKGTLKPTKVKPPKKRVKINKDVKMFANAKVHNEKQKLKRALNKQKDFLNGKVKS